MSAPSLTHVSSQRPSFHIDSLDGIRGCAALLVFFSHAGFGSVIPGGFGVTVFFFLSGYLITTLLRHEYERTADINLKQFYIRRAFRILPPMYVVLIILLLPFLNNSRPHAITTGALAAQFLNFVNYYFIFFGDKHAVPTTGPMWSLAIEEHFYLLFPLMLLFLLRNFGATRAAHVCIGICAIILVWRLVLLFALHIDSRKTFYEYTYMATDARIDSLLYGCVMALSMNPVLDLRTRLVSRTTWLAMLFTAAALLLFSFIYRAEWARESIRYSIQGVALIPIFFCAIHYSRWPMFRWLNWAWMRGMGTISYTFYLIHLKALEVAARYFDSQSWAARLLALSMAIAFSTLMYFLVERYCAKFRRRFAKSQGDSLPRSVGLNGTNRVPR